MDNIILIGMPASGKSTVGVILAKIIGYDFIDSDLLIQKSEKMKLAQIISKKGVDGFIRVEENVNASIDADRSVIATGGSAVYGQKAMKHFHDIGITVYLKVRFEELEKRLGNIRQRGVVLRDGQTLRDLYEERSVLYEKYADLTIEEEGTVEDVIEELIVRLPAGLFS